MKPFASIGEKEKRRGSSDHDPSYARQKQKGPQEGGGGAGSKSFPLSKWGKKEKSHTHFDNHSPRREGGISAAISPEGGGKGKEKIAAPQIASLGVMEVLPGEKRSPKCSVFFLQ